MKKILSIILLVVLALAASGCSKANLTPSKSQPPIVPEPPKEAVTDLTIGKYDGDIYENEYIGIRFEKPFDWSYSTPEKLREMNGIATDSSDEVFRNELTHKDYVYDMFAVNEASGGNVRAIYEKMNSEILKTFDTVAEYEKLATDMKPVYESEEYGYSGYEYEISKSYLGEKEIDVLKISADLSGEKMHQTIFYLKADGYLAQFSIISIGEDLTEELIGKFSLIEE